MKEPSELVKRLTVSQPAEVTPEKSSRALKERIDRGYVHIKFKKTGTEFGFRLNGRECRYDKADFANGRGTVRLAGGMILDDDKVRVTAEIDLATGEGTARLEPVSEEEYERVRGGD